MTSNLPCPAWVYCNNGDVHLAKDCSWFGDDYTPFQSFVTDISGNRVKVIGIGSVDLPTETESGSHSTLHLENVVHAPSSICNLLGGLVLDNYAVELSFSPSGPCGCIFHRSNGNPIACFRARSEGGRFCELKLSEPPVGPKLGPSPVDPSTSYILHASWPDTERRRLADMALAPLTQEEREWLKQHYGNEFKFLASYGLSIYDDEEREEGRAILRGLMSVG